MGRIYYCTASSTQATAGDILAIEPGSDNMAILHELVITQSSTETDDSTEILIGRPTTSGSGGGSVTPAPANQGAAASGITVRSFDTTDATTITDVYREGISVLAGFHKVWTPETRIMVKPSGKLVIKFVGDITSCTMIVSAIIEEVD